MILLRTFNALSVSSSLMEASTSLGLWGEVSATFNHSCHVQNTDGRMICISDRYLDGGPITLRVEFPGHLDFQSLGARVGMPLRMESQHWLLGEDNLIRLSEATRWVPPTISEFASRGTVLRRLRKVRSCLETDIPEEGLSPLVRYAYGLAHGRPIIPDGVSPLVRLASQRVQELIKGVWARDEHDIDDGVGGLIGMGPGLTPSGDDLLAGFMIGLITTLDIPDRAPEDHRIAGATNQALSDVIPVIAQTILRHAANGTTPLSRALLSHAVRGTGSDSVHRLLQALLQCNDVPEPTPAALEVAKPGHTSGWDCLAGIFVGVHLGLDLKESPNVERESFATPKTAAWVGIGNDH